MRVLHCCLAAFYIDGYGYQENIMPVMHKLQGHDVAILASTETYVKGNVLAYVTPGNYHTQEGIPVTRLPYARGLPFALARKLRIYAGLLDAIRSFAPDVLFLHDCQFLGIRTIADYVRTHPDVTVYVDGHTDYVNSARNWVSKNILHRIIYRYCAQAILPYTKRFYGVLPARVDFFQDMYGIPASKTELLPLGVDDTRIDFGRRTEIRVSLRRSLDIADSDFVVVSGGKIDRRKNIDTLIRAVRTIAEPDLKLIIFGVPSDEVKAEIDALCTHPCVRYVGWVPSERVSDYLFASDLAVFPGTHSVLWEQSVGLGLPCIFKKWNGMQHVDLGGNCLFLTTVDEAEIIESILNVKRNGSLCSQMREVAMDKGRSSFSYFRIAERAIQSPRIQTEHDEPNGMEHLIKPCHRRRQIPANGFSSRTV